MCTNQDIFNTSFITYEGKSFSCPRTQKGFTSYNMHFSSFKICRSSQFSLVSAILHHISLLRLLPKSYFKISTFQTQFLCSNSFFTRNLLDNNYIDQLIQIALFSCPAFNWYKDLSRWYRGLLHCILSRSLSTEVSCLVFLLLS